MSSQAKRDMRDIGDYIAYTLLQPEAAFRLIEGLEKTVESLKLFPKRHGLVREPVLRCDQIRCIPYQKYYIFYKVIETKNIVLIVRVGFNRRNWKEILLK